MTVEPISICLAKGSAMAPLADLFRERDFPIDGYHSKNRTYRPEIRGLDARAKIMAEKDVAIQVAAGNYDIGFCGEHWIREHTVKYRASRMKLFRRFGLDKISLYACAGMDADFDSIDDLKKKPDFIDIVSEYQNIAEHFAIENRLRRFRIFPAWGSVEAYPPEHADVVILAAQNREEPERLGLRVLSRVLESELCLVVNNESFVQKDLSTVLRYFNGES